MMSALAASPQPAATEPVRCVIVEDQSMFLDLLAAMMRIHGGTRIVAQAGDIASGGAAIAGDAASAAIAAGKGVYARSGLDAAVDYIGDGLEQKGVFDAIESATEAVGDKFGQITGKRLVEMLEEKLRLQDQYNDVLATRLAEALERIATVEARLNNATS